MEKVILKEFREVKDITLPISGITVSCYSSLLVSDIGGVKVDDDFMNNVNIIAKIIKDWNFYKDEYTKMEISSESLQKLPANDFQFLVSEAKIFANEQKKS